MISFFTWLQTTRVAATVGDSNLLMGALSATHLVGFTLITGGALVSNLRMLGVLLSGQPVLDITRPASRGIAVGLVISVVTGVMLFSPRATTASRNGIFQIKMLCLIAAAVFQYSLHRTVTRRSAASPGLLRATGAVGLSLWLGVALAGCAFILLE